MKWFTYSISSLATAAVSLGENSSMGEAFFGTIRLQSEAVPDGGVRMQMSMVNPAPVVVTLILLTIFIFAVIVAYNRPSARRAQSEK